MKGILLIRANLPSTGLFWGGIGMSYHFLPPFTPNSRYCNGCCQ